MTGSSIAAPARSRLHDFLAPDSIAIIGASADPTKRGYKAMVGLIKGNYRGKVYPINPKVPEILGVPTYASKAAMSPPSTTKPAATCATGVSASCSRASTCCRG